ncbi:Oidioi.mRNA.OKI2018_I69.chr1.g2932.t1.cds [Oikopleura dioica]|uniref:Oidioi.mRNA.OKI2018_I69.chr1.g2932.t1.cds n=1 Tax=Oikopleura dioica TaxID=34765 RepID=A0ABN7SSK7_OIKDI|nr:Oidioi.mRNA.OKI2018_I69.chr1.g2932.t1.cds [Oikopleura dioica]
MGILKTHHGPVPKTSTVMTSPVTIRTPKDFKVPTFVTRPGTEISPHSEEIPLRPKYTIEEYSKLQIEVATLKK